MCCDSDSGGGSSQAPAPVDNKFTDTLADIATKQYDRATTAYQPLEDRLISSVDQFNTPEYATEQEGKASADVAQGFAQSRANQDANEASLGTNPADGAHAAAARGLTIAQAGQDAAAVTGARQQAQTTAYNTLAGVSGRGDAKVGQAISAAGAGGNLYQQSQNANLQQEQINNQQSSAFGSGLGSLLGAGLSFFSSKKLKTDKRSFSGGLDAIRKMPMNKFKYKPGVSSHGPINGMDGADHVGPYAEDFADATGAGDGQTINVGDALGTTMAAVKELDKKVSKQKGVRV